MNKGVSFEKKNFSYQRQNNEFSSEKVITESDLIHRKELFEKFLTYRRRVSRLAAIQALYMYSIYLNYKFKFYEQKNLFQENSDTEKQKPSLFFHSVVYFYKNFFFNKNTYGSTKNTKRLDERFLYEFIHFAVENINKIDSEIQSCLSEKWTVKNLNTLVKSILRFAITESMFSINLKPSIMIGEYTNVTSHFFGKKEISFVNAVLQKYCDRVKERADEEKIKTDSIES